MTKLMVFISMVIFNFNIVNAQPKQDNLSDAELKLFQDELDHRFRLFFMSIQNMVDDKLDLEQKLIAREIVRQLFINSNVSVTDYFGNPQPESKRLNTFTWDLIKQKENSLYYLKNFKLSDSIRMILPYRADRNLLNDGTHLVYKGETYVYEKLVRPQKEIIIGDELLRRFNFSFKHGLKDEYDILFTGISIIEKNNEKYDYNLLVNSALSSSSDWTINQREDKVNRLKKELNIVDIDPVDVAVEIAEISEEITGKPKLEELPNMSVLDVMIPGNGYNKYMIPEAAKKRNILFKSIFFSTIGAATYMKYKERDLRGMFNPMDRETFMYNTKADNHNLYFTLTLAMTGTTIIAHIIELNRERNKRDSFIDAFGSLIEDKKHYYSLSLITGARTGLVINF